MENNKKFFVTIDKNAYTFGKYKYSTVEGLTASVEEIIGRFKREIKTMERLGEKRDAYFKSLETAWKKFPKESGGVFTFSGNNKHEPCVSVVFGEETDKNENIPNYSFDESEFLENEYLSYLCDCAESETLPVEQDIFNTWSYDFEPIYDSFREFLEDFIGAPFIYDFWNGNLAFIDPSDEDSIKQFVSDLNSWTTKGYHYTNDFNFDAENIKCIIDMTVDTYEKPSEFATLLQKIIVINNRLSGYDFKCLFDGIYGYQSSLVTDFYWLGLKDFFSNYLVEYGYYGDVMKLDLSKISQEEYDLSFYMTYSCLETSGERCAAIKAKYAPQYQDYANSHVGVY